MTLEYVFKVISDAIGQQRPLDPEIAKILEDNFWDLCEDNEE